MNFNEIIINNHRVEVDNYDITILQLCEQLHISIPRFCYHRLLTIAGNCRMCMVEIKNIPKPVIACSTTISKSMEIYTASDLVKIARENIMEFLLINHPLDCPICDQGGECDLQDQSMVFGSDRGRFHEIKRSVEDKHFGPVIKAIMSRCIHCTRCVRFAEEIAILPILGTMGRGEDTEISTFVFSSIEHELSGNSVDICPVGALTSRPYAFQVRPWELTHIDSIDVLDSLGSWIRIDVIGNEVMRVLPRRNDMLNQEWISNRVRFFYEGAKLNRLLCILCKSDLMHYKSDYYYYEYFMDNKPIKNEYLPCSASRAFSLLYSALVHNSLVSIVVSDFLNMDELLYACYFIKCVENDYTISSNITYSNDLREKWLINTSLEELAESNKLLFMNNNLKQLCSVLNARIANYHYENQLEQEIYYIGTNKLTFFDSHLGVSNIAWYFMISNKSLYGSILLNELTYISNNETTSNMCLLSYYNGIQYNEHYIALNCSTLNRLEQSIGNDLNDALLLDTVNNHLLYHIGEPTTKLHLYSEYIRKKNMYVTRCLVKNIVVLQNSHFNDFIADLYIATNTFHEVRGVFLNNLFKYQFTTKAVDLPGLIYSNSKILNKLIMFVTLPNIYLKQKFSTNNNQYINVKNVGDYKKKMKNYFFLIGANFFYNTIYTRHKMGLLIRTMNTYEIDRKLKINYYNLECGRWGSSYHLIKDTYSKNSITLSSSDYGVAQWQSS